MNGFYKAVHQLFCFTDNTFTDSGAGYIMLKLGVISPEAAFSGDLLVIKHAIV